MNEIQLRGNCQICGRQHAVVRGAMAKHGYKVEAGYFQGICGGQYHQPLQLDRSVLDHNIEFWLNVEVPRMLEQANKLERGEIVPLQVRVSYAPKAPRVPFAEAPAHMQREAVEIAVMNLRGQARGLESHALMMRDFADKVYGQPLVEVKKIDGPAPILIGERRILGSGSVAIVIRVDGARIYWKNERGFKGWTGSAAWRRFEIAAE